MKPITLLCTAALLAGSAGALAQTTGAATSPSLPGGQPSSVAPPSGGTMVTPVAPPGVAVTPVAPGVAAVTPVPGVAVATGVKIQDFAAFDLDKNGSYGRMEFAQALQFLKGAPAGGQALPARDRTVHAGAAKRLPPSQAVSLLNETSAAFAAVDMDHNGLISPIELGAAALI